MSIGKMGSTYLRFPKSRQDRILDVCISLFYCNGYRDTSTIQLKNALGVAKGTFYKYIVSKKDLFLYIIDRLLQETLDFSKTPMLYKSADILERFRILDERMRIYYIENPQRYVLLLRAISNPQGYFFNVIETRRLELTKEYLSQLYSGVNWNRYRYPKQDVINLLTWSINGHQQDIFRRFCRGDDPLEIAAVSKTEFALLLEMIAKAVLKKR